MVMQASNFVKIMSEVADKAGVQATSTTFSVNDIE